MEVDVGDPIGKFNTGRRTESVVQPIKQIARLQPDLTEAERFLRLLAPTVQQFTFQVFRDDAHGAGPILHGTLGEVAPRLSELNAQGFGVFVTINETDLQGRSGANIIAVRALWQDDDHKHDWALDIKPSIEVESSAGKFQRYLLSDELSLDDHDTLQTAMAVAFGSDQGASGVHRVLRLPGFFHLKDRANPFMVRIVSATGRRYSREELFEALKNGLAPTPKQRREWLKAERAEVLRSASSPGRRDLFEMLFTLKAHPGNFGTAAMYLKSVDAEDALGELEQAYHVFAAGNVDPYYSPDEMPAPKWTKATALADKLTAREAAGEIAKLRQSFGYAIEWPHRREDGSPVKNSQLNVRAFLEAIGATLFANTLSHKMHVEGLDGFDELDDKALRALWLMADASGLAVTQSFFDQVVLEIARQNPRHPIKDYLSAVEWDGDPRIDDWLVKYAGAEDTKLNRAIGRMVLLAAVRRVRQPGAKFDFLLTLLGPQGAGKSLLIAALAVRSEWFSDSLALGSDSKHTIEQTQGKWIVEISELGGMNKREIEGIKAMLSRTHDVARLAYERSAATVARQFIMIGTTNNSEPLRDHTGNRRFLVVNVGKIDLEGLRKSRDQLWAEAAVTESAEGEIGLPMDLWGDAAVVQEDHTGGDPIYEIIATHLEGRSGTVHMEALYELIGLGEEERAKREPRHQDAIGKAMSRLKWKKTRLRVDGSRAYFYEKIVPGETGYRWVAEQRGCLTAKPLEFGGSSDVHTPSGKVTQLPSRRRRA